MKIIKWVDMSREIDIEIGLNDVRAVLAESFKKAGRDHTGEIVSDFAPVLLAFNQIAMFMKAVTIEQIGMLNAQQRKTIGDFLAEQAKRFV
jgi:hypothetical protein